MSYRNYSWTAAEHAERVNNAYEAGKWAYVRAVVRNNSVNPQQPIMMASTRSVADAWLFGWHDAKKEFAA